MTREEVTKRLKALKARCERLIVSSSAGNPEEWRKDAEALDLALSALRPVSRERVERMRGEWKHYLPPLGAGNVQCRCTKCGRTPDVETPFCAWCGAPMTDEAVQMIIERLEALRDNHI